MKMNTVNVVETVDNCIVALHAFDISREGVTEAEALFASIAKANGLDSSDVDDALDDGFYENGNKQVALVHSA